MEIKIIQGVKREVLEDVFVTALEGAVTIGTTYLRSQSKQSAKRYLRAKTRILAQPF